ncbi:MAG: hypothetical protein JWL69_2281 [Phycisphaerales bacterium]|nr:hypothetical protein [Phycisphaerales bacterium]
MRSFLAGLLILLLGSMATAQVTGFVESVGFENHYRPDCWTPLVVNLTSQVSEPMEYQLQVWQEDLDKDRVLYTKDITLSPKVQEKYQLYFLPRPSDGLPSGPSNMADLQKALQVRVCLRPAEGKRPEDAKVVVERLPVKIYIDNADPTGGGLDRRHGKRLVLVITDPDTNSKPAFDDYNVPNVAGLTDDIVPIHLRPADLGENVLYYASIDAVVWLNAQADALDSAGAKRREALDEYVREGGKLIVCQPPERQKIEALAAMLPVETKDAGGNWLINFDGKKEFVDSETVKKWVKDNPIAPNAEAPLIDALPELAKYKSNNPDLKPAWHTIKDIKIARAKPKDGAVVEVWENWKKGDRSPYIVRQAHGLGCVTWVAQDFGDPNLTGPNSSNWPYVWDRVIGWHNDTLLPGDYDKNKNPYESGDGTVDFGPSMLQGTDYTSKGATYIFLAILFFVVYWVAAGPGTYFFLAGKKRKELNWFAFGAWAFVGTALTVLVVRLLLRGDAEVRHLTVIRSTPGEPAVVYSRVGLYIPRDGEQAVALKDNAKEDISYITPLQIHPAYVPSTDFPAAQVYSIPVHDDPQPVSIKVPFRSTLKKLEARWVGDLQTNIGGSARLVAAGKNGYINGTLTNQTGTDLKNIYIVFNHTGGGGKTSDWALFIPRWDKDKSLDLSKEFDSAKGIGIQGSWNTPGSGGNVKGTIQGMTGSWDQYWTTTWGHGNYTGGDDDRGGRADFAGEFPPRAFPIMSLYDRLNPGRNIVGQNPPTLNRVDFIRRGGRMLDMSPSVAAGRLVILAQSDDDKRGLPFPLMVEGSRVEGEGRIYYQFALPIDRSEMEKEAEKAE